METLMRWGKTPDDWDNLSLQARYKMIAFCQALDIRKAWESLGDKERRKAALGYLQAKRRKRSGRSRADRRRSRS
jgi:hypothetical protein